MSDTKQLTIMNGKTLLSLDVEPPKFIWLKIELKKSQQDQNEITNDVRIENIETFFIFYQAV